MIGNHSNVLKMGFQSEKVWVFHEPILYPTFDAGLYQVRSSDLVSKMFKIAELRADLIHWAEINISK